MRLALICFLFYPVFSFGQFAVITDKDGYANTRSKAEIGDNVLDKLPNGHLIYCFDTEKNWTPIDYVFSKQERDGYIYKDRYTLVTTYTSIPLRTEKNNQVQLGKDSVEITVIRKPFDKAQHTFQYDTESKKFIEKIDGKKYWGTDGEMPKNAYQSIQVNVGKKSLVLPSSALEGLYEPTLYATQAHYDRQNDILYIHSQNSDGAGGYAVIWKIEKGLYKERLVVYGF